jgi:hypothetical protein
MKLNHVYVACILCVYGCNKNNRKMHRWGFRKRMINSSEPGTIFYHQNFRLDDVHKLGCMQSITADKKRRNLTKELRNTCKRPSQDHYSCSAAEQLREVGSHCHLEHEQATIHNIHLYPALNHNETHSLPTMRRQMYKYFCDTTGSRLDILHVERKPTLQQQIGNQSANDLRLACRPQSAPMPRASRNTDTAWNIRRISLENQEERMIAISNMKIPGVSIRRPDVAEIEVRRHLANDLEDIDSSNFHATRAHNPRNYLSGKPEIGKETLGTATNRSSRQQADHHHTINVGFDTQLQSAPSASICNRACGSRHLVGATAVSNQSSMYTGSSIHKCTTDKCVNTIFNGCSGDHNHGKQSAAWDEPLHDVTFSEIVPLSLSSNIYKNDINQASTPKHASAQQSQDLDNDSLCSSLHSGIWDDSDSCC